MSEVLPYETLVEWLATAQVPPGTLRLTRGSMLTDTELYLAWLRQAVASEPQGQVRLAIWMALARLHDALMVEGV